LVSPLVLPWSHLGGGAPSLARCFDGRGVAPGPPKRRRGLHSPQRPPRSCRCSSRGQAPARERPPGQPIRAISSSSGKGARTRLNPPPLLVPVHGSPSHGRHSHGRPARCQAGATPFDLVPLDRREVANALLGLGAAVGGGGSVRASQQLPPGAAAAAASTAMQGKEEVSGHTTPQPAARPASAAAARAAGGAAAVAATPHVAGAGTGFTRAGPPTPGSSLRREASAGGGLSERGGGSSRAMLLSGPCLACHAGRTGHARPAAVHLPSALDPVHAAAQHRRWEAGGELTMPRAAAPAPAPQGPRLRQGPARRRLLGQASSCWCTMPRSCSFGPTCRACRPTCARWGPRAGVVGGAGFSTCFRPPNHV
jgi:hypothetical protein